MSKLNNIEEFELYREHKTAKFKGGKEGRYFKDVVNKLKESTDGERCYCNSTYLNKDANADLDLMLA